MSFKSDAVNCTLPGDKNLHVEKNVQWLKCYKIYERILSQDWMRMSMYN